MAEKHTISTIFPNEQFCTIEGEGDDEFFPAFSDINDAAEQYGDEGGLVATYKLVKVEKLKLMRSVNVVKVK